VVVVDVTEEVGEALAGRAGVTRSVAGHLGHRLVEDLLDQLVLVTVVPVERGAADHRAGREVAHRDAVEPAFLDQLYQGLAQQGAGAADADVRLRHFRPLVSFGTGTAFCSLCGRPRPLTLDTSSQ
jgi:hypothetical protein